MSIVELAAVILAGGTGARLSGAEKARLELEGRTLLDHALDAVADSGRVVVVGDRVAGLETVGFVREDPAYGGPAAALLTGIASLPEGFTSVVVLAVDMPRVTPATVLRLVAAADGHDGAALADSRGRQQLALVLDLARLRAVAPAVGSWHGLPLRKLLAPLVLNAVPALGDEGRDVDTWTDLRDLRG